MKKEEKVTFHRIYSTAEKIDIKKLNFEIKNDIRGIPGPGGTPCVNPGVPGTPQIEDKVPLFGIYSTAEKICREKLNFEINNDRGGYEGYLGSQRDPQYKSRDTTKRIKYIFLETIVKDRKLMKIGS